MVAQQTAVAGDRRSDAGEAQHMPQRRLRRSHDRLADPRLELVDNRVRAEIEARDDHAVAVRIPGAERKIEDRFGFGLGEAETVTDAEMRAGDRLDAALGEEFVLGGIDLGWIGRDRGHLLHAEPGARLEDAVRRARPRAAGDMADLLAQMRIE